MLICSSVEDSVSANLASYNSDKLTIQFPLSSPVLQSYRNEFTFGYTQIMYLFTYLPQLSEKNMPLYPTFVYNFDKCQTISKTLSAQNLQRC